MGAEFLTGMESSGDGTALKVEHDVVRVIPGDVETVRAGLMPALEQLGYRIVNDDPLHARRKARGLGKSWSSNNILDYKSTLTIVLKQTANNATRATFDYMIGYTMLYEGDKATLNREVDALIGLMQARASNTNCAACTAPLPAGARFCRQCGAPNMGAIPAEVEVYQMTALTNTSYKNLMGGFFFTLFAVLLPPFLLLADPQSAKFSKLLMVLTIVSLALGITGLTMLVKALRISKRMIRLNEEDDEIPVFTRRSPGLPIQLRSRPRKNPPQRLHPSPRARPNYSKKVESGLQRINTLILCNLLSTFY